MLILIKTISFWTTKNKLFFFVGLTVLTFTTDLYFPLGVAAAVPYVAIVVLTLWARNHNYTLVFAALASLLTIIGYFISSIDAYIWKAEINRGLTLAGIWVGAYVAYIYNKMYHKIEKAKTELEKQVKERTRALTKTNKKLEKENKQRKKIQNDQKRLMNELKRSNEELENFAYVASHDLRAPLRAIGSLSEWLYNDNKDKLSGEDKENLTLLKNRAKRMNKLIDGILQFSRVGRKEGARETIDLNKVVADVFKDQKVPKSVEMTVEDKLPTIQFPPTRAYQIFENLIGNAVKYMDKEQGRIRIGVKDKENAWEFYVADNGPGIKKEHFDKIFQLFNTLHPRDKIESTGLGLSIVKKIIERNGGHIWLNSDKNQGTTFYFTVPKKLTHDKQQKTYTAGRG